MTERDLFDQLSEIEGDGPRAGFLDDLERRVLAARTDVGPATPTDPLIEGVVPMPDTSTAASRRLPLLIAAAAAIVLVVALVAFLGGDDEGSSPNDVVTEPDPSESETTDPEPADPTPENDGAVADNAVDSTEDDGPEQEDGSGQTDAAAVAAAWIDAYDRSDEAAFRELHALDARVTGTVLDPGAPAGTLDDPTIADTYWAGWEARLVYNDRWEITPEGGVCAPANDGGFDCVSVVPAFGPGSEPFQEFRARIQVLDGLVSSVVVSISYLDAEGGLAGGTPQFFLPSALDVEGTPPGQACLDTAFNSVECGLDMGDYWIAHFRQFAPDALVLPPE